MVHHEDAIANGAGRSIGKRAPVACGWIIWDRRCCMPGECRPGRSVWRRLACTVCPRVLSLLLVAGCAEAAGRESARDPGSLQGDEAFAPPAGFVAGEGAFAEVLAAGGLSGRVAVYSFEKDFDEMHGVIALLELFRRASPEVESSKRWARALALDTSGVEPPPKEPHWFNYHSVHRDSQGRPVAEWGWVSKGERVETYEHFVADGDVVWHVRLSLHGSYPPKLLRDWLMQVFDQPFDTLAPPERKTLLDASPPR